MGCSVQANKADQEKNGQQGLCICQADLLVRTRTEMAIARTVGSKALGSGTAAIDKMGPVVVPVIVLKSVSVAANSRGPDVLDPTTIKPDRLRLGAISDTT